MINDEEFSALSSALNRDHPGTGFVLLMFDPGQSDGEVLHATNVKPMESVHDTLRQYMRLTSTSPNHKEAI